MSGTNNVPLGARRKRESSVPDFDPLSTLASAAPTSIKEHTNDHADNKRHGAPPSAPRTTSRFGPELAHPLVSAAGIKSDAQRPSEEDRMGRPTKRRSRWADDSSKAAAANIPTALPSELPPDQIEGYIIQLRIEEINRKLRSGDYLPFEKRSVSPPPEYGADGRRTNTRDMRYRKRLEDERHRLVQKGTKVVPNFRPPVDYRRPMKMSEKLYVPVRDFPQLNFIGLIIGPRGNTLKTVEAESGAKISIRGKGSVKEGKARSDGGPNPGDEEDLHCIVSGDTEEKIRRGMEMINKIIETATSIPESQNELKRNQLRELAALNGTLRDDENQICNNCGGVGHRKYECPEKRNITSSLICRTCGGAGHIARDCMERGNPRGAQESSQKNQNMDNEYASLMAEIGTESAGDHGGGGGGKSGAPWAAGRQDGDGAPPWARRNEGSGRPNPRDDGAPPWARRSDGPRGPPPPGTGAEPSDHDSAPPWARRSDGPGGHAPGGDGAPPWARRSDRPGGRPPPPHSEGDSGAPPWAKRSDGPSGDGGPPPWARRNDNSGGDHGAPPWARRSDGPGGPPPPSGNAGGSTPWQHPGNDVPPPPWATSHPGPSGLAGAPPPPPPPSSTDPSHAPWMQPGADGASATPWQPQYQQQQYHQPLPPPPPSDPASVVYSPWAPYPPSAMAPGMGYGYPGAGMPLPPPPPPSSGEDASNVSALPPPPPSPPKAT